MIYCQTWERNQNEFSPFKRTSTEPESRGRDTNVADKTGLLSSAIFTIKAEVSFQNISLKSRFRIIHHFLSFFKEIYFI